MNERIKELREMLKLSQEDFANTLNLRRNSISLIEGGKRNPSDRTILDICDKFSVSEEWIRTGKGEVFVETPSSTMEALRQEFSLDDFAYNLVYEYLKLDESERKTIRDFFYRVVNQEEGTDLVSEAPSTPEELEAMFPPVEGSDSETG